MTRSFDEWSAQYWQRRFSAHHSMVDTAKLMATFSLATAATLVASALQAPPQNRLDAWASFVLAVAFVLTLGVVALDRLKLPDRRRVLETQQEHKWNDEQLLHYVQILERDNTDDNEATARHVRAATILQVVAATVAACLAVISLFQPAA